MPVSEAAPDTLLCACPRCMTRFRVSEALLRVAAGQVRCGACLAVFDGRAQLRQRQPGQTETNPGPPDDGDAGVDEPVRKPAIPPGTDQEPTGTAVPAQDPPTAPATGSRPVESRTAAWALPATVAAVLLLVANVLTLQFDSWAGTPPTRGIYEVVCAVVGCELAPFRSLADIRAQILPADRPGAPEELSLALKLTNEARFAQPFPLVSVRFTDADGQRVAGHRAEPADYLESGAEVMWPNQTTRIEVRAKDPGAAAVAYSLALL